MIHKIKRHTLGILAIVLGGFLLKELIIDKISIIIPKQFQVILGVVLIAFGLWELNKL